jgi:hypothetical protein
VVPWRDRQADSPVTREAGVRLVPGRGWRVAPPDRDDGVVLIRRDL